MTARFAAMLVAAFALAASNAEASDLPFDAPIRIGQPPRDASLHVANVATGVEIAIGTARHTLAGLNATGISTEVVGLSGGASIVLLTLESTAGQRLVLAAIQRGRITVIWNSRSGLHGDPGERRGHVLVRQDRDGDGIAELGFIEHHERIRTCANEWVPVRTRWLNPRTLMLETARSVVDTAAPDPSTTTTLEVAATTAEGFAQHPRVAALRGRWSDAQASMESLAPLPDAAVLFDRSVDTAVEVPARTGLRVTLGVSASGMATRAVAITSKGASGATRDVHLRGDGGAWFHVTLPGTDAPARHWIALPAPQSWRCIELALQAAAPPFALAELELFTDVDAPDGLAGLLGRVVTDDRNGTEAARVLVSLGKPGIDALAGAWESLGGRGKRRAVVALQARIADSSEGRQLMARAANDPDGDLRDRALAMLTSAPEAAFAELVALATHEGPGAEAAIRALGKIPRAETAAVVLNLLASSSASHRQAALEALDAMVATANEHVVNAVGAWLETAAATTALTTAIGSLAKHPATRPNAQVIWAKLSVQDLSFDDLWRLVLGSAGLDSSADVDAWLSRLAEQDERWMLRDAALASMRARSSAQTAALAMSRLDDAYPRVRARAVAILATDPARQATLQARFATEPWPMVRSAILNEQTSPNESRALRIAALRDTATQVRIAAIAASERLGDTTVWPQIAPMVRSNNEWPAVIGAAIQFASTRCITEATPDLRVVLKRGLKPDAWAPDVDLAMQAIDTLGRFGTVDALALLRAAQSAEQPPAVRDAAARAAGQEGACRRAETSAASVNQEAPSHPAITADSTAQ